MRARSKMLLLLLEDSGPSPEFYATLTSTQTWNSTAVRRDRCLKLRNPVPTAQELAMARRLKADLSPRNLKTASSRLRLAVQSKQDLARQRKSQEQAHQASLEAEALSELEFLLEQKSELQSEQPKNEEQNLNLEANLDQNLYASPNAN